MEKIMTEYTLDVDVTLHVPLARTIVVPEFDNEGVRLVTQHPTGVRLTPEGREWVNLLVEDEVEEWLDEDGYQATMLMDVAHIDTGELERVPF